MLRGALLLLCAGLGVAEVVHYYPQLPETVASHFDGRGTPDGWSSKGQFFGLLGGLAGLMLALFGAFGLWIPRMNSAYVNLPHKEYWLAPERRGATLAWLGAYMLEMGVITMALMLAVTHLTIQANLVEGGTLQGFGWVFGGYILLMGAWLARVFVRFRRP